MSALMGLTEMFDAATQHLPPQSAVYVVLGQNGLIHVISTTVDTRFSIVLKFAEEINLKDSTVVHNEFMSPPIDGKYDECSFFHGVPADKIWSGILDLDFHRHQIKILWDFVDFPYGFLPFDDSDDEDDDDDDDEDDDDEYDDEDDDDDDDEYRLYCRSRGGKSDVPDVPQINQPVHGNFGPFKIEVPYGEEGNAGVSFGQLGYSSIRTPIYCPNIKKLIWKISYKVMLMELALDDWQVPTMELDGAMDTDMIRTIRDRAIKLLAGSLPFIPNKRVQMHDHIIITKNGITRKTL